MDNNKGGKTGGRTSTEVEDSPFRFFNNDELVPAKLQLSAYETTLVNKDESRVFNIKLAAAAIEGYELKPGKTFSFNKVVGRRTAKKGYRYAPIIIGGKNAYGRGGGICQLSTTLYNAAKDAGLEIVERHLHARKVPYEGKGSDATVVYDAKDLKFRNNKYFPVVIHAEVSDGKVKTCIDQVSKSAR
ncbi:MAG: VanW family protein [Eubacteriales bacterium]|nr:VanW family protein [Eubacteriales bacterium]